MTSGNAGLGWIESRFADLTSRDRLGMISKVPKSSYKGIGRLPVIDQGQEPIAGYVDDYELQFRGRLPVIVFGDHTRKFKYVDFPFAAGADGTRLITPSSDRVDVRFFYYALCNIKLKNLGYSRHFKLLKEQVVRFPESLLEQRKIAAILSSVDDAIEKTQAVIDQAQIVKRGLMQELFTRGLPTPYSCFPEGWMAVALGDVATVVGGGTPKRSEPDFWNGNVPWATPTDVTGLRGRTISQTASSITEAGLVSSSATLLPPNSLLMTTRATIGACAINRVEMATNQGFQSLVPKAETCVDFLYYLVQYHVRRLEQLAAGSTFLEVSKRTVRGFRVHMPPPPEQHKIAAVLSSVDNIIEKNQAVMDRLQVVKSGLMPALLTGELRVTPGTEAA